MVKCIVAEVGTVMRFLAVVALVAALGATPAGDRMGSLKYLVGTWTCTYQAKGAPAATYTAIYSYDLGGAWMREADSWNGGGGDIGLTTYDPKTREWSTAVLDSGRGTTIFRARDDATDRRVWHSAYPDATMTLTWDKVSPTEYTVAFVQTTSGKTIASSDRCKKHPA